MIELIQWTRRAFWSESIWLPPGMNWTDIPANQFTDFNVMYQSIPLAFIYLFVRIIFEWIIARPLGRVCGLPDPGSELPNIFKRIYRRFRYWLYNEDPHPSRRRVRTLSGKFRPITILKSRLDKFCESLWRLAFYLGAFIFGIITLWDKPWFWDAGKCFDGYPYQEVDNGVKYYYIIEAGFYTSLMISQFTDVQRKDFEMMFVHHLATLGLLWFSWGDNFVRVGSLILAIHDCADITLELAKCFRYLEMEKACNVVFAIFALTWFSTRCGVLPYYVIYATVIEAPSLIVWFPVYYIFNSLLLILQVLHIVWSWMIANIVYEAIIGHGVDDTRSDDEQSDLDSVVSDALSDDDNGENSDDEIKKSK